MLPDNSGNYSERESTKSKFKRAFGFKMRKQGSSPSQDDPGFQSDYIPQPSSHLSNPVPTSSNAMASTVPTRRPNPKMALQFASNTLQAWGRKSKQPARSPRPLPDPPGPPPRNAHAGHHQVYDQRPRGGAKSPPPLLLPIQSRMFQRTSQLLPGPDISAALEYMMDPGAGPGAGPHDDKRKAPAEEEPPPHPSPQPTPIYPPSRPDPSAVPRRPGTIYYHPPPQSPHSPHSSHSPPQSPSRLAPRRASISSDSHATATQTQTQTQQQQQQQQQRKRRSASLGTLDVPSIVTISSTDPSPSTPSHLPFSSNVPPSSYHAPPSKSPYISPPQPTQPSTPSETYSPPHSPPFNSEPSNKPAIAGSPQHAHSFRTEVHNIQGGSLNSRAGSGFRGMIAGWTNGGAGETPSSGLSSQREHSRSRSAGGLIGQFAPAVAKRAYEKVNHMWSGGHSNTSQTSVGKGEDREGSNKPWHNRTPNGPSGYWSGDERAGRPGSSGRPPNDGGYTSDALVNGMGNGPHLGPMLRPPFRRATLGHGGFVFGLPLADCVRDTKPLVVLGDDRADVGIEGRFIPALVLRCVQHLERWGVQEEGIFRISGRASHVTKLRNEFASGADYDLASCGPGDLDPHAVSSVLKAFLRELPDPILTRDVAPAFEAALERAKASGAMNPPPMPTVFQGPGVGLRVGAPLGTRLGLPAGPRQNSIALSRFFNNDVHIAPGTLPVEVTAPTPTTPVKPPNSLLREFNDLVQRLPPENHDLLQTIVELLARATVHAKTTKMPLSNLLLVFCPSVGINSSVFKIMVENHEPIFDQALLPPPSPSPSEHPSEGSDVYEGEGINAANATSQPTPSTETDYRHPRTPPPQLPRKEPAGLQLDLKPPPLPLVQATEVPNGAASPPQSAYLHSPGLGLEPNAGMMSPSPQPPQLVSNPLGPQTTSHATPPSMSPSSTPSSSSPSLTSELNATVPNPGLQDFSSDPQPPKPIPVPYALQPAASQSSLHSHSSTVSIPSVNPSPSVTLPPAQQDLPAPSQDLSDGPSAFSTHQVQLKASFDKPLPNPDSPVAPVAPEAPSPVSSPSPSVPSPTLEDDQNSGDDADSEAKPGRRQYPRVVSMAPALPEFESLPPMTASFAGSIPSLSPPPPMPSLAPLFALAPPNMNSKSMFTSTITPLKVKGRGSEPAKLVSSRTGTSSSTSSSLESSISRQLPPGISPSDKEPVSVKGDALDEDMLEVSETLPLGSQLTPLMRAMEEDMVHVDDIQEKTSGTEPSGLPEQSRPSSAEPPKRIDSLPLETSPPVAESSTTRLDTFVFGPSTHTSPEAPIIAAALPTAPVFVPPIVDPVPEDIAMPKDEIGTSSKVECESLPIGELISTEMAEARTQDHTPLQNHTPPQNLSINEVVDTVERQSASPSPLIDALPQREGALDTVILAESQVVAPPRLAPPGEGRLSDDWAASVLMAATTSP